ncbi:MAG: hypothetical protein PHF00_08030 [Elusimicrobia bacterium]|nr:hypothetical protein [Elusimicrobiota bacterium]
MRSPGLVAVILAFGTSAAFCVEDDFQALDMAELRQAVAEYRHKAALLRKSVGLRDQRISDAQSRASAIVEEAEAEAARRQQQAVAAQQQAEGGKAGLDFAASLLGQFGGNSFLNSALQSGIRSAGRAQVAAAAAGSQAAFVEGTEDVKQARAYAVPLEQEAKSLEGDKKKLALKAEQYERLADAKDLLIAAETLRHRAQELAGAPAETEKTPEYYRSIVERMDVW